MLADRLEWRLLVAALACGLVAAALAIAIVLLPVPQYWRWMTAIVAAVLLLWLVRHLTRRAVQPLTGATTVIDGLRDGDYSLRIRPQGPGVLGEFAESVNRLAEQMHDQSVSSRETGLLLSKILEEIDLPVFAFRSDGRLVLSNPAARRLIGLNLHEGVTAEVLGIEELLHDELPQSVHLVLPGGSGRFLVRRRTFRQGGVPHQLLVLAEVGSVLSAERNEAWQGLVRVMSHEINNSLSPIKSMAETWQRQVADHERELDRDKLAANLEVIARRAGSLSRFVGVYAGLAKLPEPERAPVHMRELAGKVCALEPGIEIDYEGEDGIVHLDADQIEQALINLLRNAAEAVSDQPVAEVSLRWKLNGQGVCIDVLDNGSGPPDSKNLFLPFFTTKPGGSGIGLLLVRRIAELHGGWFELQAREDGSSGALARLWIPDPQSRTAAARSG